MEKYCSCDKECQFSALQGIFWQSNLEKLTISDRYINKRLRLSIGISKKWDPRPRTFTGTRDPRPRTHLIARIRESRFAILKVGPETRDPEPWKWNFSKFSQLSLKPGAYEWIHVLYACMSILYAFHYPIIKQIHFQFFIILKEYSDENLAFSEKMHTLKVRNFWNEITEKSFSFYFEWPIFLFFVKIWTPVFTFCFRFINLWRK